VSGLPRLVISAVAVLVALGVGTFYATGALGQSRVGSCSSVRVSGDDNAAGGGQVVASVRVRNVGTRVCTISGRPWIRLGPLRHAITVRDATRAVFGSNAGVPGTVVTLQPRQRAYAAVLLYAGSCSRGIGTEFAPRLRAGWVERSAVIDGALCKNGSGSIWVGSFQRHS
jgi:hypothetical protein